MKARRILRKRSASASDSASTYIEVERMLSTDSFIVVLRSDLRPSGVCLPQIVVGYAKTRTLEKALEAARAWAVRLGGLEVRVRDRMKEALRKR